ncbi:MAG: nitroreductase [Pseudomonadota bacterium]|nr:nitroreductase [Pseudomonadota bacterium]
MPPLNEPSARVDAAIESRFSVRAFRPDMPVPRARIEDILRVASRAPSGANTQPWKVYVLQGAARDTLCDKVCAAHDALRAHPEREAEHRPDYDYYPRQWLEPYLGRRRHNGWTLYGLLGIAKGDKDRMHAQHQRNFRFFDAPVGLMLTAHRALGQGSLLDCGMFLQNIMLAARARGLHTCPQAAWNHYARIVLPHIGAPAEEMLVCGMALGHADESAPVNTYATPREPVQAFTQWVDDPL